MGILRGIYTGRKDFTGDHGYLMWEYVGFIWAYVDFTRASFGNMWNLCGDMWNLCGIHVEFMRG